MSESCGTGLRTANIKNSRLIRAIGARQKRVPVKATEQAPGRDGANVNSGSALRFGGVPHLTEPPDLFFAGTAEMGLSDCYWCAKPVPGFTNETRRTCNLGV